MKFSIIILFLSLICSADTSLITAARERQIFGSNPKELRLTITENSIEGSKWRIYIIAKGKLRIYDKPFHPSSYKEHLFTDHKFDSRNFFQKVSQLGLDTLQKLYLKNCPKENVTAVYTINLRRGSRTFNTELRNYYKEEIHNLITLINEFLPNTLQITYLTPSTKQTCD